MNLLNNTTFKLRGEFITNILCLRNNLFFFGSLNNLTSVMAPVPLEGLQTLVANSATQGGLGGPQEGSRGGMISLAKLIDYIIQRTYHELTVLAEL